MPAPRDCGGCIPEGVASAAYLLVLRGFRQLCLASPCFYGFRSEIISLRNPQWSNELRRFLKGLFVIFFSVKYMKDQLLGISLRTRLNVPNAAMLSKGSFISCFSGEKELALSRQDNYVSKTTKQDRRRVFKQACATTRRSTSRHIKIKWTAVYHSSTVLQK